MATHVSAAYTWPSGGGTVTTAILGTYLQRIYDALTGVGMVQTSDTGQYVPGTTTWPGSLGAMVSGYWMFRFADALQATQPIFVKFRVGVGGNWNASRKYEWQVGTTTNGTGTLGGILSTLYAATDNSQQGAGSAIQEYACFTDSTLLWLSGYNAPWGGATMYPCMFGMSIERTRDTATGLHDSQGHSILSSNVGAGWRMQAIRTASPTKVGTLHNSYCLLPGLPSNPLALNGDKLLFPHFYDLPDVRQRHASFSARNSDFPTNPSTFTATPVAGGSPRTFLAIGASASSVYSVANASDNGSYGPMFLWE